MSRKSNKNKELNLLEIKPVRNYQFEVEGERVIVFVPKFKNRFLVKWLVPRLKRPNFLVKLDEHGSFIWNHCDGNSTVGQISDKMKNKFGENFDPTYERIGKFVSQLMRDKFLIIEN